MELRQLRYLVALADEQHFTRAAERMHVAQPALSAQIRRLEAELGLELVHRTTRRVALTEPGEVLVARARRALNQIDAARAELADIAGVRSGRVVIGAMQSLGPFDLSALLAAYHGRHPDVELVVREHTTDRMLELLRHDELDLCFLSLVHRRDGEDLSVQRLAADELVVILPPRHPLSRRRRVRLSELRDERFIMFNEGASMRRIVLSAAMAADFEPQVAFDSNEVARIRAMVSRGLGVAVVPASDVAGTDGAPIAVATVIEPRLERDITLAWRSGRWLAPAARAFLALAQTAGPDGEPGVAAAA